MSLTYLSNSKYLHLKSYLLQRLDIWTRTELFLVKPKVSFTVEYKENLRFYQDLLQISAAGGDLTLSEDILSLRDT